MAFELAIVTVLAGVALGLRFKVLILVPAVAFATAFTMIVGIARADQFGSIVLIMVIVGTAVQLGYLVGIATAARQQPAWRQ
jgi:archaellum biogenesis protein FlaJ (TadC family)